VGRIWADCRGWRGYLPRNAQASAAGASAGMNTPRDPSGGVRAASFNSMFARDEGAGAMRRRRELETQLSSLPSPPSGFGPEPGHPESLVPGGTSGIFSRSTSSSSFGRVPTPGYLAPYPAVGHQRSRSLSHTPRRLSPGQLIRLAAAATFETQTCKGSSRNA